MIKRAFIGYLKGIKTKGWIDTRYGNYSAAGLEVLHKYEKHNPIELNNFFLNIISFRDDRELKDMEKVFDKDWTKNYVEVTNSPNFLNYGKDCDFGYIYNLNEDKVEVYRGGFLEPDYEDQPGQWDDRTDKKYYTKHMFDITRDNIDKVKEMFTEEDYMIETYGKNDIYWDKNYMLGKYHYEYAPFEEFPGNPGHEYILCPECCIELCDIEDNRLNFTKDSDVMSIETPKIYGIGPQKKLEIKCKQCNTHKFYIIPARLLGGDDDTYAEYEKHETWE
jgi:hypothetical protein